MIAGDIKVCVLGMGTRTNETAIYGGLALVMFWCQVHGYKFCIKGGVVQRCLWTDILVHVKEPWAVEINLV